jgi:hypothetical protein
MMHPYLSSKLVDHVNHTIDHPNTHQIILNHIMTRPRNAFIQSYLTKPLAAQSSPHRKYGHDYMTGMMLAAQMGPDALTAFMDHMTADRMRDSWVQHGGMYYADLVESSMMYGFHAPRRRRTNPIYRY